MIDQPKPIIASMLSTGEPPPISRNAALLMFAISAVSLGALAYVGMTNDKRRAEGEKEREMRAAAAGNRGR